MNRRPLGATSRKYGFLALTVPAEYGGLGENHVAFAITFDTVVR